MIPILFQVGVGFGGFQQILSNMMSLGFFQFLFPFLLALAIFYGVLQWGLGDRISNSAVSLISLILSFFVMLFASANPGIVGFLQNISGGIFIAGSGLLFLVILFGIVGFKVENLFGEDSKNGKIALGLVLTAIAIMIFFGAGGSFLLPSVAVSSDMWTIVFFVIILALVLWFMGGQGSNSGGSGGKPKP